MLYLGEIVETVEKISRLQKLSKWLNCTKGSDLSSYQYIVSPKLTATCFSEKWARGVEVTAVCNLVLLLVALKAFLLRRGKVVLGGGFVQADLKWLFYILGDAKAHISLPLDKE